MKLTKAEEKLVAKLVGRTIVKVDLDPSWESAEGGGNRRRMHSPRFTLDDGAVLFFVVEEHPEGGEYGVDVGRNERTRRDIKG